MCSEYIRAVQIEEERVSIFSAEIYKLNSHPRRHSVLFVDLPLRSCFVLFSWFVFFQFNFAILSYCTESVMIVTHVHLVLVFIAFSFAR